MREMNIRDYMAERSQDDILVDLRDEALFRFGSIPGAIHVPLERIRDLYRFPKDKPVYLFCQTGELSGEIAGLLSEAGYDACNLTGGYREYLRGQAV